MKPNMKVGEDHEYFGPWQDVAERLGIGPRPSAVQKAIHVGRKAFMWIGSRSLLELLALAPVVALILMWIHDQLVHIPTFP